MENWLTRKGDTLLLDIYLQPRASRDEVVALFDERLKIRLKAPPVDGKANQALIRYVAKLFGVAKRDVTLLSGATDRRKRLCIEKAAKIPVEIAAFLSR